MKIIDKIAEVVIKDNTFFMVRKAGKDIWTNLGGKPEQGETDEEALMLEIKEEINCSVTIINKVWRFAAQ